MEMNPIPFSIQTTLRSFESAVKFDKRNVLQVGPILHPGEKPSYDEGERSKTIEPPHEK